MKRKHTYLLILAMAFYLSPALLAQNMVLRLQGGTDQTIPLSNLQKITFSNNNLVLNYVVGGTQLFGFNSLEKIFFSPYTYLKKNYSPSANIFFNSADNQIHFRNLEEGSYPVVVYQSDGRMVINTSITNNESIDMSIFPASIYLIRINNQTLKFKK
jgi:hypothetical protein